MNGYICYRIIFVLLVTYWECKSQQENVSVEGWNGQYAGPEVCMDVVFTSWITHWLVCFRPYWRVWLASVLQTLLKRMGYSKAVDILSGGGHPQSAVVYIFIFVSGCCSMCPVLPHHCGAYLTLYPFPKSDGFFASILGLFLAVYLSVYVCMYVFLWNFEMH